MRYQQIFLLHSSPSSVTPALNKTHYIIKYWSDTHIKGRIPTRYSPFLQVLLEK